MSDAAVVSSKNLQAVLRLLMVAVFCVASQGRAAGKLGVFTGVGVFNMGAPDSDVGSEIAGYMNAYPDGFDALTDGSVSGWGGGFFVDFDFPKPIDWGPFEFTAAGFSVGMARGQASINTSVDFANTPSDTSDDTSISIGKRRFTSLTFYVFAWRVLSLGMSVEFGGMEFATSTLGVASTKKFDYLFPSLNYSMSSLNLTGGTGLYLTFNGSTPFGLGSGGFQGSTYSLLVGWAIRI